MPYYFVMSSKNLGFSQLSAKARLKTKVFYYLQFPLLVVWGFALYDDPLRRTTFGFVGLVLTCWLVFQWRTSNVEKNLTKLHEIGVFPRPRGIFQQLWKLALGLSFCSGMFRMYNKGIDFSDLAGAIYAVALLVFLFDRELNNFIWRPPSHPHRGDFRKSA